MYTITPADLSQVLSAFNMATMIYSLVFGMVGYILMDALHWLCGLALDRYSPQELYPFCPNCNCRACSPDDLEHLATELSNHNDTGIRALKQHLDDIEETK
jgi:hypothetical protein